MNVAMEKACFVDDVEFPIQDVHYTVDQTWQFFTCPIANRAFHGKIIYKGVHHRHGADVVPCLVSLPMAHLGPSNPTWPWQKMATRLPKYCRQRVPYSTRSMKELFPGYAPITAKSMS